MYIYIYIYKYVHICIHIHSSLLVVHPSYIYMLKCVYIHIYVSIHIYTYIYIYICIYIYRYMSPQSLLAKGKQKYQTQISRLFCGKQCDETIFVVGGRHFHRAFLEWYTLPHTAYHCNMIQHIITNTTLPHCNTLQHTATFPPRLSRMVQLL